MGTNRDTYLVNIAAQAQAPDWYHEAWKARSEADALRKQVKELESELRLVRENEENLRIVIRFLRSQG